MKDLVGPDKVSPGGVRQGKLRDLLFQKIVKECYYFWDRIIFELGTTLMQVKGETTELLHTRNIYALTF